MYSDEVKNSKFWLNKHISKTISKLNKDNELNCTKPLRKFRFLAQKWLGGGENPSFLT